MWQDATFSEIIEKIQKKTFQNLRFLSTKLVLISLRPFKMWHYVTFFSVIHLNQKQVSYEYDNHAATWQNSCADYT